MKKTTLARDRYEKQRNIVKRYICLYTVFDGKKLAARIERKKKEKK